MLVEKVKKARGNSELKLVLT